MPDSAAESAAGEIVFLAVKRGHSLRLYAHRDLRDLVSKQDLEFVQDLLEDMLQRAQHSPDELFEQLCDLSIGPVVTDAVQSMVSSESSFEALYPNFSAAQVPRAN